jgi:opacity protein-like surface antigen
VDVGYRYTKVLSENPVQSLLSGGDLSVNQFRVGVGFGF